MWAHLGLFSWLYLGQCFIFSLYGSFYFPFFCITTKSMYFAFSYSPYSIVIAHLGFSSSSSVHECFPLRYLFSPFFQPSFLSSLMCFYTLLYPPLFICLSFIHLVFPSIHAFWSLSISPILSTSPLLIISYVWLPHPALHHSLFSNSFVPPPPSTFPWASPCRCNWWHWEWMERKRVPTRTWVHLGSVWLLPGWVCIHHLQSPLSSLWVVIDHVL